MNVPKHGLGAATAALVAWIVTSFGVDVPPGVEAALSVVAGYLLRLVRPGDADGDGIDDAVEASLDGADRFVNDDADPDDLP